MIISMLIYFYENLKLIFLFYLRRRPAWTDRILFRVSPNNYENVTLNVEQKSYQAHSAYTLSDHKPVTAEFVIKVSLTHEHLQIHIDFLLCLYTAAATQAAHFIAIARFATIY